MKKILFLLGLLFSCIYSFAELEVSDQQLLGTRMISVDEGKTTHGFTHNDQDSTGIYVDKDLYGNLQYGLNLRYNIKSPSKKTYQLYFYFRVNSTYGDLGVMEGSRLMLKLKNGENITLKSSTTDSLKKGGFWGYYMSILYDITPLQINKIIKSGEVAKMRIEFIKEPIDFSFNGNTFYDFVKEAYPLILTTEKKDSFTEGF